jgi:NO-binding membrane sensor protein with MHYT domain
MRVISCVAEHNLWMVMLAACVCIAGSLVTMRLLEHARRSQGVERAGWVLQTASAAGASVWCTHFVAVLAYDPHAPISFDAILTIASLGIAVLGFAAGFAIAARSTRPAPTILAGAVAGITITTMHYVGMTAYHVSGIITWDMKYVALSLGVSITLSIAAVCMTTRSERFLQYAASAVFVLAIVSLHFTGMTAVSVIPLSSDITNSVVIESMAIAIAFVSLFIIASAFASPTISSAPKTEDGTLPSMTSAERFADTSAGSCDSYRLGAGR